MGDGAFGSNGSVHWDVSGVTSPGNGVDTQKSHPGGPNGRPVIGAPNHPEKFRVRLRYSNPGEAQAAVAALNKAFVPGTTTELVLDIRVRPYRPNPGPTDTWEIGVDW
jgi:hypothetical protein